jgi:hypothetical protein
MSYDYRVTLRYKGIKPPRGKLTTDHLPGDLVLSPDHRASKALIVGKDQCD